VDHAYDGGSRLELIFTGRINSADLCSMVAEIAQSFTADVVMVDGRGADYTLPEAVEDSIKAMELSIPVVPVTDAAIWGDRLFEAKQLVK
jgi:hypothetical protein